ncbi:DNA-binding LacI/PurR family transcriptional regulator [Curtobacterium sp. PvP017]
MPRPAGEHSTSRPTMRDVAEAAGVSRQLVSLVFRDLPGASATTRARVLAVAEDLGYHPDASARLLRGSRSHQIGVVFSMREPYEVDLVEALLDAGADAGFTLVLGPLSDRRPHTAVLRELLGHRIEALLVLAADGGVAAIDELPPRIPVVTVGGPRSGGADDVRVDEVATMRLAVQHLVGLGHRDVAHVSGGHGPNADERRRAYEQAMTECGLTPDVVESAFSEAAGSAAAQVLLARERLPTGIVAGNDRAAVGLIATLVRTGVSVPEDVSVVGIDDSSVASLPYVDLTTVRHDPGELARRAVDAVVQRVDEPDAPALEVRTAPRLVERRSTARPADR